MFCPQCGQQQAINETRFCPRCGFPLVGVAELVAAGGEPPSERGDAPRHSRRREGVRQGVLLMMLAAAVLPLVNIIGEPYHEALLFTLLIAGVLRLIYALAFQEGAPAAESRKQSPALGPGGAPSKAVLPPDAAARPSALPPAREAVPAADFINPRTPVAPDTSPVAPRSVAERTTKFLGQDE